MIGTKLRNITGNGYKGLAFFCPGCDEVHDLVVEWDEIGKRPKWGFNQDYDKPTLTPSVRHYTTEEDGSEHTYCHYFITDGKFNYCGDCDHKLNGQQGVEIPDWPHAPKAYGGIDD